MHSELDEFKKRGVQVVAIGQGTGEEASRYCESWGICFDCLGDPTRKSYALLHLERGSWWSVVLRDLISRPGATLELIRQADFAAARLPASDPLQLGGVAILSKDGALEYLHVAQSTNDIPSNRELLAALDRAVDGGARA